MGGSQTTLGEGGPSRATIDDTSFRAVFPTIAIIGTITWLAIFEHNYHPRIYSYNEDVTILQAGDSEQDFNHLEGAFNIWWQTGREGHFV